MGGLWAALPELSAPATAEDWLPAYLGLVLDFDEPGRMYSSLGSHVDFGPWCSLSTAAEVREQLARYPGTAGAGPATHNGELVRWPAPSGQCIAVDWSPDRGRADGDKPETISGYVARRFPRYPRTTERWLIPAVGDASDFLPPSLLW